LDSDNVSSFAKAIEITNMSTVKLAVKSDLTEGSIPLNLFRLSWPIIVGSGWTAALMGEGFLVLCALFVFFGAESVVRLFNNEPGLVETGSTFLRIAATGYLIISFYLVFQYCISGSGDTMPPMVFGIIGTWLIQLPMAYFLPKDYKLGRLWSAVGNGHHCYFVEHLLYRVLCPGPLEA
jgi:Na+-driven multidrug efflux pump